MDYPITAIIELAGWLFFKVYRILMHSPPAILLPSEIRRELSRRRSLQGETRLFIDICNGSHK